MLPKVFPLLLASLFAVLGAGVQAQEIRRVTLDGKDGVPAPAEENNAHEPDYIAQVTTPTLEIYPAAAQPSARGTIMVSPGGGYRQLAITKEGRNVAKMLNAAGWDAAILLYHVNAGPDTRSLALEDAKKAFTLLQRRGGEFGLSTARTGAMGFSAGGHLTARLGHDAVDSNGAPSFLVLIYPAYLEKDGKILDEVAPGNIPVFLYVGDQDKAYYPSSVAYAAACQEKGVRCEYGVAAGVGHSFGLTEDLPAGARAWPEKLRAFLGAL